VVLRPYPQNLGTSSLADLRYFTPMLPVIAVLMGAVFGWIHHSSRLVAGALLLTYLGTNLLGLLPFSAAGPGFRMLLPAFVLEILKPYPTACSETCAYLRENSRQDETLWYWPDWMGNR